MVDTAFNQRAMKRNLYRFRAANAGSFEFISADTLHEASEALHAMGIRADTLLYEGQLVTRKNS